MSLATLKKELRLIVSLTTEMAGNPSFAEDLVMLERHRRALLAAISVEYARRRRQRRARRAARATSAIPAIAAKPNRPGQAA